MNTSPPLIVVPHTSEGGVDGVLSQRCGRLPVRPHLERKRKPAADRQPRGRGGPGKGVIHTTHFLVFGGGAPPSVCGLYTDHNCRMWRKYGALIHVYSSLLGAALLHL